MTRARLIEDFNHKEAKLIEEISILSETLFYNIDEDIAERLLWKHEGSRPLTGLPGSGRREFVCYIEDTPWMDHFAEGTKEMELFLQIARLCGFHAEGATYAKLALTEIRNFRNG